MLWAKEGPSLVMLDNVVLVMKEYNHDRAHRRVENRTPREVLLAFTAVLKNTRPTVRI